MFQKRHANIVHSSEIIQWTNASNCKIGCVRGTETITNHSERPIYLNFAIHNTKKKRCHELWVNTAQHKWTIANMFVSQNLLSFQYNSFPQTLLPEPFVITIYFLLKNETVLWGRWVLLWKAQQLQNNNHCYVKVFVKVKTSVHSKNSCCARATDGCTGWLTDVLPLTGWRHDGKTCWLTGRSD